jgi:hypothetical protein
MKYAVTDDLDVIAAYYHYIQNSYFGTPAEGLTPCFGPEHSQCAGTFDAISAAADWRFAPNGISMSARCSRRSTADWPSAFSSATTSIPPSGCVSGFEGS